MATETVTICHSASSKRTALSPLEADLYYAGLPSRPRLVFRTGSVPWNPEAREVKEIRPVFDHSIATVWDDLGPDVCNRLISMLVSWTSVDVVRFAIAGKAPGSPVLWIGVMPQSLSFRNAAAACEDLLKLYKITDVEVEFRESIVTQDAAVGPKLLKSVPSTNVTAEVRVPLTPALGLWIAAQGTSDTEGTGALFLSDHNKLYLLSVRHVVLPEKGKNRTGNRVVESQENRKAQVDAHQRIFNDYTRILARLEGDHLERRLELTGRVEAAQEAINTLNQLYDKTVRDWGEEKQRVLGHIAYSPPIALGTGVKKHTEDWALIEVEPTKIDWETFMGNAMDLGTKISKDKFIERMYPHYSAPSSFKYPPDRLLPLWGVIKEDELCHPQTLDENEERCLIVIKNGFRTGVTTGRATGIMSFVRRYLKHGLQDISKEWAILPYNSDPFSDEGDSGSIIVDGKGRVGGLLTGGTGREHTSD